MKSKNKTQGAITGVVAGERETSQRWLEVGRQVEHDIEPMLSG